MVRAAAPDTSSKLADHGNSRGMGAGGWRGRIFIASCVFTTNIAIAQGAGVTTQGNTGGLVVPSARVLEPGTVSLTAGNFAEPQLGG